MINPSDHNGLLVRLASAPGRATGFASVRVRQVVGGERLDLIAWEEYGSSALWRVIADFNQLDDPFRLQPGRILHIPALSQGEGGEW